MTTELSAVLACARCDKALDCNGAALSCSACDVDFPRVAEIPWLFAEPNFAMAEWRQRLDFLLRHLEDETARLAATLENDAELLTETRERLTLVHAALGDHRSRLETLLAPLAVDPPRAKFSTYLALRTRLPPDQGLTTYYANVHRDWSWGDDEHAAALELVRPGFAERGDYATVLVLGSGAGRLAYDVHATFVPELTVALDFNPLLQFVARRVATGQPLALYEFPLAPRTLHDHAVLRELAAPAPARPGFELVLGDALRPPFRRGAFDTVITPWLIDIVPEDLGTLARRVNTLLKKDGTWINIGSLAFMDMPPDRQFSAEECAVLLPQFGFEPPSMTDMEVPYMCSPASRHGRRERVLAWHARKAANAKSPPRHSALPDWLVKGTDPVPLLDAFKIQATSTRIHAGLMNLIDGRRSIRDMARLLVEQRLMGPTEAEPAIRRFLTKMYDDSRHARRL
jgi:hypothetical protein